MSTPIHQHPSSYRDPSGFIFEKEGVIYRQVNPSYKQNFDLLIKSGCYDALVKSGLLIPHEQLPVTDSGAYTILKPAQIPFVSYPYEWSFGMLKDAALLTLRIMKQSLSFGLVLKDATPFNVQWHDGNLIFIDTLSFEKYEERPWVAYRQFCESMLAPLLLMHYNKTPLQELILAWPNGIPVGITSSLLPWRSRFSIHVYLHIHLHARVSKKKQSPGNDAVSFSKQKLLNLLGSLESLVSSLRVPEHDSTWSHYYEEAAQRGEYLEDKKAIIGNWVDGLRNIHTAADLGANEGVFSKLLAYRKINVLATDFDPYCIDRLYNSIRKTGEKSIQPLVMDLANPSPAIGVNNNERSSFIDRMNPDLVMALALIHHLHVGKNIPFPMIASFFARVGRYLIIEYVDATDEKSAAMLRDKKLPAYSEKDFTDAFAEKFNILKSEKIKGASRKLYLMENKNVTQP